MKSKLKLIESNPEILSGKPVIKGTRILVAFILKCLTSGITVQDIVKGFPHLIKNRVLAAIKFASLEMEGEEVYPIEAAI